VRKFLRASTILAASGFSYLCYVYLTLPDVRVLATQNPATTAFIELRKREAAEEGRPLTVRQRWVPYTQVSNNLRRAVLVAEDSAFFDHEGIDIEQIKVALEKAIERGDVPRGASTITQQLAKNLYLSPSRDPLRKVKELMITWRLETALSKARILEIYLNVIEWGDLVWGAEAAARTYFGVSASALSREQAALLAGAIINPRVYSPANPRGRLLRRQQIILARMPGYEPPVPVPASLPATASEPPTDEVPSPTDEPATPTVIDPDQPQTPAEPVSPPAEPPV